MNADIISKIGNTPLVRINKLFPKAKCEIAVKAEFFNPLASIKDRPANYMVRDAEQRGLLKPGGTLVEATSGNTGIAMAYIAAVKGYKAVLAMPESMSLERRKLLRRLGVHLELTAADKGMKGAIGRVQEIVDNEKNCFWLSQFDNPANVQSHYDSTGPEIWRDSQEQVTTFIAGVGTGGTISGAGAYLKEQNTKTQIVAVEPSNSPVISGGKPGKHTIQGIGAGFIPGNLNTDIIDETLQVSNQEADIYMKRMAMEEGLLVGISSGGNLAAVAKYLEKYPDTKGLIVTMACDTGERYLSIDNFY